MIKGAIFDVDGTLLDSMTIWEEAGARYLRGRNVKPEEKLGEILFPMTLEEAADYMKRRYSLPFSAEEIISGVLSTVKEFYYYEAPLKEGAKGFLEQLKERKIPVTVATSSERDCVAAAFQRLHISEYVGEIFTCSEVGKGKTSPEIYHAASRFMGTAPEDTWVFEDVLYAIRTAKRAGYRVAAIYDRSSEKEQGQIQKESDVYLRTWTDFAGFYNRIKESDSGRFPRVCV